MPDHRTKPLPELAEEILANGLIQEEDVVKIKEHIDDAGLIDREEADFLFLLNDGVSGRENDPAWKKLFVEAITKHVLEDDVSPGVLDEDEANYLFKKIKGDGIVDELELALMVHITDQASECAPSFNAFLLESLKEHVIEDGIIDANEVEMVKTVIYGSGSGDGEGVDRAEADFLFDLNDATTGNKGHDPSWKKLFVEAITKHVLEDDVSPGVLDEDEANYLLDKIKGDGIVDELELALMVHITDQASECASSFNAFLLESLKEHIIEDGIIDANEVEMVKTVIYGTGSGDGEGVDRAEADFLFDLNDATTGNKGHDPSWKKLFVEAIAKHVLEDDVSPGVLDEDEANYLLDKIKGDGIVDELELALMVHITDQASECAPSFNAFLLESLKEHIIEDGIIDANEVEMVKTVIYGTGSGDGEGVDRAEADFLFDLNDATTGNKGHDPSWKELFVEAIAKHVLEDDVSPKEIDEEESDWLISRIEGDGEYDENEKALLKYIKEKATKIDKKLQFKIQMHSI